MTATLDQLVTDYDLRDRFRPGRHPVLLTGVQALVRLLVEQHARDARAGRRTGTFVSGYQGSPLAGLDKLLGSLPELRRDHGVHFTPGLNEELGATAVWGSQLEVPGKRTTDGVVGVWYGKGPGVDRAGDALRHGNVYGAHPKGGVLVLAGDDPGAKSSSLPCVSERTLAAMGMPVLYPRNAAELIELGLYGVELSRASGCWVGMKIVAGLADGMFTLDRDVTDLQITVPQIEWDGRPWSYEQRIFAAPPDSLYAEADLFGPRWAMVEAFAAANPLDVIEVDPRAAWLGIAAPGMSYDAVRQTLHDLGLDDAALHRAGIRLLRIGLPTPLSAPVVRRFAEGLTDIVVVEEKTSFVETQLRDLLYGVTNAPRVVGKRDVAGRLLIPADGELTAARLEKPLRRILADRVEVTPPAPTRIPLTLLPVNRAPYFCSGCPHNRSTVVPEGSVAAGGIGCHAMVTMSDREVSQVTGLTQMGGEGAQWIGQAPFTETGHLFQNMGDGTYFHSGQLAVQACIAAGTNITFKILYNRTVAMTGAQDAEGALPVPVLTRKLHAEGVRKIIVCADEPQRYGRRAKFAPGVDVWHRDRLDEAQKVLREIEGVTVLIYDQQCAAEARRLRKRGKLAPRTTRVVINEAVCEGCGDCGRKSNCLSVQPVDTEFGRKTRIDQTSCNTDYSCLDGDCPSFVTVQEAPGKAARKPAPTAPRVADPVLPRVGNSYDVFLAGIGGTGIVTVNQVLATAALRAGLHSAGLDQTGLSQKAGPVTSHLRLSAAAGEPANRLSPGSAGCYLAFDLLTGADAKNLAFADPARTVAVVSTSRTPTGAMVENPDVIHPADNDLLARVQQSAAQVTAFDALDAAERLFGSTASANLLLVGAAYQAGALPLPAAAIEWAIELNGVAVETNLAAFRWGRAAVADPGAFADATARPGRKRAERREAAAAALVGATALQGETRRLAVVRAAQLIEHTGKGLAARYVGLVAEAWDAERAVGGRTEFSEAVARGLHRLMAYKDEYEVARLLTDPAFLADVAEQVPGGTKLTYKLHPPALRAMGLKSKIGLGPAMHPALRLLARGRVLRGTPLDPFGRAEVRRVERELVADYIERVEALTASLTAESYDRAVAIAAAAELVKGYEDIKLASVARYRETLAQL